jgi:hypothetical protein
MVFGGAKLLILIPGSILETDALSIVIESNQSKIRAIREYVIADRGAWMHNFDGFTIQNPQGTLADRF